MSSASKMTLAAASLCAMGSVFFVHSQQVWEKEAMHAGVVRDMERQRIRAERQADFEQQRELEEQYRKLQKVVPIDLSEVPEGPPQ